MSLGEKTQVSLQSNDIAALNDSILHYMRKAKGFQNLAVLSELELSNVLYQWSKSELGSRFLKTFEARHLRGVTFPSINHDWSISYSPITEVNDRETMVVGIPTNTKGSFTDKGTIGFVKNLIRFYKEISGNTLLAKSSGSGIDVTNHYLIQARPLQISNHPMFSHSHDSTLYVENYGQVTLRNPNHGYTHCGANVMREIFECCLHVGKHFSPSLMIPDAPISKDQFVSHVQDLQAQRIFTRNIEIRNMIRTGLRGKTTSLLKGTSSAKKKRITICCERNHISLFIAGEKKRKISMKPCELCNTSIKETHYETHLINCKIVQSRSLANLAVVEEEYQIHETTLDDIHTMDDACDLLYRQIVESLLVGKHSICIIGPGGNGKSFLISKLISEHPDTTVRVLTPTGIVSADYPDNGMTWQRYSNIQKLLSGTNIYSLTRSTKELKSRLNSLWKDIIIPDILVFEELSMVNGRDLNFLSLCFSIYLDKPDIPWGGIPVVYCGDPGQLGPFGTDEFQDYPFTTSLVQQVCNSGYCFQLNHPRRLALGCLIENRLDTVELTRQCNLLAHVRFGRIKPELMELFQNNAIVDDGIQFKPFLQSEFNHGENVLITVKNSTVRRLINTKYQHSNLDKLGLGQNGIVLWVERGMRFLITDNWVLDDPIYNGTDCIVQDYVVDEWVDLKFEIGNNVFIKRLYKGGAYVPNNQFALSYYYIRTITKSQGMTIKGKVYIYIDGPNTKIPYFAPGCLYVAISRCINLNNVVFISTKKLKDVLTPRRVHQNINMLRFMNDPTTVIPQNALNGIAGSFYLWDSSSLNGQIVERNISIATNDGQHSDRWIMNSDRIYNNTLNIDHETGIGTGDLHGCQKVIYTSPLWIFNGQITDFKEFIQRNGGTTSDLPEYTRLDGGEMQFSLLEMEDPMYGLALWINRILMMVNDHVENDTLREYEELNYFYQYPMHDLGFNNLGFDIRFFIRTITTLGTSLQLGSISGGGSNLKHFTVGYSNSKPAYIVFDLMGFSGQGTLASKLKAYVEPFLNCVEAFYTLHSKLWITGKTPSDILLDESWSMLDDDEKCTTIKTWYERSVYGSIFQFKSDIDSKMKQLTDNAKFKKSLDKHCTYFVQRCKNAGIRDEQLLTALCDSHGKGCFPLKYVMSLSRDEYIAATSIDLIDVMTIDGVLDLSICFFPREMDQAQEMLDENPFVFSNYNIPLKMQEYATMDVKMNDYLMRILNNLVYSYGNSLECCQFYDSWDGLRLSLFSFPTTASLSKHMRTISFPSEMINQDHPEYPKTHVHTKLPHYPLSIEHIVTGIVGGKTLARSIYYNSSDGGVEDYCTYLDVSGMYMDVMEREVFPYGPITIYSHEHNDMSRFSEMFCTSTGDLFTRCRLFTIRARHLPHEIENVLATKILKRNTYTNDSAIYQCTHAELAMLKLFGGIVEEFITVVEWTDQCEMFKNLMQFYNFEKGQAEANGNSVARNFTKLLANATFGVCCKGDKNIKTIWVSTPEQHDIAFSKYSSGLTNETVVGNYTVYQVTDVDLKFAGQPAYLGRFVLGYSKKLLYTIIHKAYGPERGLALNDMICYGDTDSIVVTQQCMKRFLAHDECLSEEYRILYDFGCDPKYKAGKLTDELADDTSKYMGREYASAIANGRGYPNFKTGFRPRILSCFNPQSKSGANCILFPPLNWPDGRRTTALDYPQPNQVEWHKGYKCFAKGVSASANLCIKVLPGDSIPGIDIVDGVGKIGSLQHNAQTWELLHYSFKHCIPFTAIRPSSVMKRFLFLNDSDKDKGICFGDVYSLKDVGRTIWGNLENGRLKVFKPEFRHQGLHYTRLLAMGYTVYDILEGYTVPLGYPLDQMD